MSDVYDRETSNLEFILDFSAETSHQNGPVNTLFTFGDGDSDPLAVEARYSGIHKDQTDERWMMNATPFRISIVGPKAMETDPIARIAKHLEDGGRFVQDDTVLIVHENRLTLPTTPELTSYCLGHVSSLLFMLDDSKLGT